MIQIENDLLTASINPKGAELFSLKTKVLEEHELIWQRDPSFWPKSAPILFPIVGNLLDGEYLLEGNRYEMERHGLVRTRDWECVYSGGEKAEFGIQWDEEMFDSYPFEWSLKATFELLGPGLRVLYEVRNLGDDEMFFSIGSHPAFALNFGEGGLSEYFIEFDGLETLPKRHRHTGRGLSSESYDIPGERNALLLSETIFDEDALIFKDVRVHGLELGNLNTDRKIIFNTGGAPDLGIWAKPKAPYVCIEPWYGYDDPADHDQNFRSKPGIQTLAPGDSFHTHYSISLNDVWFSEISA